MPRAKKTAKESPAQKKTRQSPNKVAKKVRADASAKSVPVAKRKSTKKQPTTGKTRAKPTESATKCATKRTESTEKATKPTLKGESRKASPARKTTKSNSTTAKTSVNKILEPKKRKVPRSKKPLEKGDSATPVSSQSVPTGGTAKSDKTVQKLSNVLSEALLQFLEIAFDNVEVEATVEQPKTKTGSKKTRIKIAFGSNGESPRKPTNKKIQVRKEVKKAPVKATNKKASSTKATSKTAAAKATKKRTTTKAEPSKKAQKEPKTVSKSETKTRTKETTRTRKKTSTKKETAAKADVTKTRAPAVSKKEVSKTQTQKKPKATKRTPRTTSRSTPTPRARPATHSVSGLGTEGLASVTETRSLSNLGISPYVAPLGEPYMSKNQHNHFHEILIRWREKLMADVDRTVNNMQGEVSNLPDPVDQGTNEGIFEGELRTRDRERQLIKKISQALDKLSTEEYGYCEDCGIEIGLRRLEARPIAFKCVDCKERDEVREKQERGG